MTTVPVLWVCGATGVGKSVVGFEIYVRVRRAGITAAYVDLAQIGFYRGDPGLGPANLAAIWPAFAEAGAQCLILTGDVREHSNVRQYVDGIPSAGLTLCRLRAQRESLTRRILSRIQGDGPQLPGDKLKGLPAEELGRIVAGAELDGIGDIHVDTERLPIDQVASEVGQKWLAHLSRDREHPFRTVVGEQFAAGATDRRHA